MTEQKKKIFEIELKKLPKEIWGAIFSPNWDKKIENIGKKYRLLEEEIESLQDEASLILLGFENPDSYASNIENNIGLTKNETEKINIEVQKEVFEPIYKEIAEKMNLNIKNEEKKEDWENNVDFILTY